MSASPHSERRRARELGLGPGRFEPGRLNAITDVAGVRVGQVTLRAEADGPDRGPVRTGVTAIVPAEGVYAERVMAGSFVLNGAGELMGLTQVAEWGLIETPILLTDTLSVGVVGDAVVQHVIAREPTMGRSTDVVIPVVGECDDSWMHDVRGRHVRAEHVLQALEEASSGPVAEGNVGAGTGMITCDFAGGVGTASRLVPYPHGTYTLGVLVLSNFGTRDELTMDGLKVGQALAEYRGEASRRTAYGSIVAVLATDAPLLPQQLDRLSKRMALGIGRVGSSAANGSGEICLAFSTHNRVPRERKGALLTLNCLADPELNPLFQAAIETTEEAILNALCMGTDLRGIDDHFCPALPLEQLAGLRRAREQGVGSRAATER
ncbi:MAG: P1 family peptidase [Myxococcales bacterium]